MKKKIERLQVIFKTAERCNIACKYCYYFFAGDESFKDRPPVVKTKTVTQLAKFLNEALIDIDINTVHIIFHGGEPMLQKKKDFEKTCDILKSSLDSKTNLVFGIQTNGMLVDEEWIQIFAKYNILVGVSIDGDAYYNDINRIDHYGRGTYHRVVAGLNKLKTAFDSGQLQHRPALVTVLNHEFNYSRIIRHFVDDLKIDVMRVLLPDMSHNDKFPENTTSVDYGKILIEIFDITMSNTQLNIYPMFGHIQRFQQKHLSGKGQQSLKELVDFNSRGGIAINNQIIVIQSDGEISLDDSFIPALKWRMDRDKYYIDTISLHSYLKLPVFEEIENAYLNLPKECKTCTWANLCGGGDLENRYKNGSGFNQPSVYCEGLKLYYEHIVGFLYKNGYPEELLMEKLTHTISEHLEVEAV